jgi:hypothetical protein
MKGMRLGFASGVLIVTLWGGQAQARGDQPTNLLVIDTVDRQSVLYQPFFDALNAVGFKVTYLPLDSLIDQPVERIGIERYKAAFFLFGSEFLRGMYRSHLCVKTLGLLGSYAQRSGVLLGLIFPPLNGGQGVNIIGQCAPIFDLLGFRTPRQALSYPFDPQGGRSEVVTAQEKHQGSVAAFCYLANLSMSAPLESRPVQFHTTLNLPHSGLMFDLEQMDAILQTSHYPLFFLPLHREASDVVLATLPYGLYWFNPLRDNHIFLANTSILDFAGIKENFHICPVDFGLRTEMLDLVKRMMWEVLMLSRTKHEQTVMQGASLLRQLPASVVPADNVVREQQLLFGTKPLRDRTDTPLCRKVAWMEIPLFEPLSPEECAKTPGIEQERTEQQDKLVDYIMRSGMDGLWITLNPHMYYSPIARIPGKEREDRFLKGISLFTAKLQQAAQRYERPAPAVLVGFEITNNIYEPNMPKCYPVDLYEGAYYDLPIPIDIAFWRQEIKKPLEVLVQKWADPVVSHGVRLGGVVLDLEMYCRKTRGDYPSTVTFDARTFNLFLHSIKNTTPIVGLRDRVLWLMQQRRGKEYFSFLEKRAENLGRDLQQHFKRCIPGGMVMCYMPSLPVAWFYKGLCRGLSEKKQPLELLTFNTEFFAHEPWLLRNRIYATHASVLMLSKLKDEESFRWLDNMFAYNEAIWLNRVSRFVERKTGTWMSIEQPLMDERLYEPWLDYLNSK